MARSRKERRDLLNAIIRILGPLLIPSCLGLIFTAVWSFFESIAKFNHPQGGEYWDRIFGCYLVLLIVFNYILACFVYPGSYIDILRQRRKTAIEVERTRENLSRERHPSVMSALYSGADILNNLGNATTEADTTGYNKDFVNYLYGSTSAKQKRDSPTGSNSKLSINPLGGARSKKKNPIRDSSPFQPERDTDSDSLSDVNDEDTTFPNNNNNNNSNKIPLAHASTNIRIHSLGDREHPSSIKGMGGPPPRIDTGNHSSMNTYGNSSFPSPKGGDAILNMNNNSLSRESNDLDSPFSPDRNIFRNDSEFEDNRDDGDDADDSDDSDETYDPLKQRMRRRDRAGANRGEDRHGRNKPRTPSPTHKGSYHSNTGDKLPTSNDSGKIADLIDLAKYVDENVLIKCKNCGYPKPERAHHCSVCNKCILKQDHHCPWINACVGHHNHRYFYLFMAYLLVGCVYFIAFGSSLFYHEVVMGETEFVWKSEWAYVRFLFSFILCVLMFVAVGAMVVWHTYLIATGQSLIEFFGNMDSKEDRFVTGSGFFNEHDFGIRTNFKIFFNLTKNNHWITIFLPVPISPFGDGIHWLHCSDLLRNTGGSLNVATNLDDFLEASGSSSIGKNNQRSRMGDNPDINFHATTITTSLRQSNSRFE